jgi:iron complex outermembrane receptor protein
MQNILNRARVDSRKRRIVLSAIYLFRILACWIFTALSVSAAVNVNQLDPGVLIFDIPPQNLDTALVAYSDQAKVQIIAASSLLDGAKTTGISGKLSKIDAIGNLLHSTSFGYKVSGPNTITVVRLAQLQPGSAGVRQSESTVNPSGEPAVATTIDEIVVTAQKRNEKLQDVPIAITAVTPAALDRFDINDIRGLTKITPNTTIEAVSVDQSSATVFIRGIGDRSEEALQDPPNAVSVDGVYLVGYSGVLLDTYDVQQVEVLRGPQGTLQGRNAVGGAINLTTKRPTYDPHLDAELGTGNYKFGEARFTVQGGLVSDKVAAKVFFATENRAGYIRNLQLPDFPLGSVESYFARAGLLINPNTYTDIYLTADYSLQRTGQTGHSADDANNYPRKEPDAQLASANCAVFGKCTPDADWTTTADYTPKNLQKAGGLAANANFDFGATKLTSITGFRRVANHQSNDLDSSSTPEFIVDDRHIVQNQFSQELRLASQENGGLDFGGKMDWVAGLYLLHQHFDLHEPVFLNIQAVGLPTAACPLIPGARTNLREPGCFLELSSYRNQTLNSYAGFGHATWRFTDTFSIFGGFRYTRDKKDYNQEANVGGVIVTPAGQNYEKTFTNTSFDAGAQYKITPNNIAYMRFAQAYRAGGFNSDSQPNLPDTFNPEKANSYEIGLKSEFNDRRYSVNSAVFRIDYKDLQRAVAHFVTSGNTQQILLSTTNAAKAKIQGFEIEGIALPVDDLRLQLSIGYLDAKYIQYSVPEVVNGAPTGNLIDLSNLRLPFTPKTTVSFAADYTFHFRSPPGVFSRLTAGLDVQHRSALATSPTDTPVSAQDGYALINAHFEFSDDSKKYSVVVWGNNLANKHYILNGELDGNLNHFQVEGLPRMFGIRLGVHF